MAGRTAAANAQELGSSRESSFLDHILRRLESSSDQEAAAASPSSNSIEALDHASAVSPNNSANPWQYLSNSDPSSPTLQRDFYNLAHSPPVASENPWMELEQQQRVPLFQADDRGGARGGTLLQRRREQLNPDSDWASEVPTSGAASFQSDAMLYEELAAAWYRKGHLRAASASPRGEGLQGMWEGLLQAYASEENFARWGGNQNADSASVNPQFDPNVKLFGRMDTSDEAAARSMWQRSMQSSRELDGQFVESSQTNSEAADMDTRTVPSFDAGGNVTKSSGEFAGSPNTSLSSGSGGDDSDDEECARNVDAPSALDSSGKRKTPAAPGELEEKDDSARTSEITDLKKTAPSE